LFVSVSGNLAAVLVVEDDPDICDSVVEVLEDAGRHVLTAKNGAVALSKLAALPRPCLIVLDLMMPGMDGFEFLRQLSARPDSKDFVVLVISANPSLKRAEDYPGVLGTLPKPFSRDQLLSWVEQYCPR
jgi:CheY-like chemotaxis protein